MRTDEMSSYALRPFQLVGGPGLATREAAMLRAWADKNLAVLVDYWNGAIEFTEAAVAAIQPL